MYIDAVHMYVKLRIPSFGIKYKKTTKVLGPKIQWSRKQNKSPLPSTQILSPLSVLKVFLGYLL